MLSRTPPSRCRALVALAVAGAALLWIGKAGAETFDVALEYPAAALTLTQRDGFVDVRLPDCQWLARAGAPALPIRGEQIVLPAGTMAIGVEAISSSSVRVPCGTIRPAQPPAILGPIGTRLTPPQVVPPDPTVYQGTDLYPAELAEFRGTGRLADIAVAACEVHPVQYDPATGDVIQHIRLTLRLELAPDPNAPPVSVAPREMSRIASAFAQERMHGDENLPAIQQPGQALPVSPGDYQYVIVTDAAQLSAYEAYADWKTAKGVPATAVTVEWIAANFSGRDLAEKIRYFVIDAVETWGTSYVLLGGDHGIVPSRISWAFECEAGLYDDEDFIPCDLYYSDLDGTWDDNGNGTFGEVGDDVDLYPDVLVGRAPTDVLSDATGIVNKFLTYEQNPPAGHAMEAFFFAEILWQNPYTDSGIGKDMIADRHFGAYEPIERQYESMGNESASSVWSYLNWGPHLANHDGHAFIELIGCGNGYLYRSDAAALQNGPRYFVLYSIGCWSAAFDYESVGESFALNPRGGTIAYVGNSRYGWGSPGNPGWGYSETFDSDFYGAILTEGLTQFGAALAWPKILRIPYAQEENVYRVHEYQVNLLGDPEMTCHTAEINNLVLELPTQIPIGATQFTVTAADPEGPVAGARICLAGIDVYQVGITDAAGQVTFAPDLPQAQTLTLTATAASHVYAQTTIIASGADGFLSVTDCTIDDDPVAPSTGNGDGEIGAGETVELYVTLHNYGGSACTGVEATIADASSWVTVIEGSATYGSVGAGDEVTNASPFVFTVDPGCPGGEQLELVVRIDDDAAHTWTSTLPLGVVTPGPRVQRCEIDELVGDGDGVADPGETIALNVYVVNEGSGDLSPLSATLSTSDPDLTILVDAAGTGQSLPPGECLLLTPAFEVAVGAGCPPVGYCDLDISFTHDEGVDDDSFLLAIGEPGFTDNMESGEGSWVHGGATDYWHLTDYRQHSGYWSWYCGTPLHQYQNNASAVLTSPWFVAPENASLSFWCYFDVTIYGVDGMFVEVWLNGGWETLDYLGSGGALGDSTLFLVDWAEHEYDLSALQPGSSTRVRFAFASDASDTDEGFYVDDVVIRAPSLVDVGLPLTPGDGSSLSLVPITPNPTDERARWRFSLPTATNVIADIFDTNGRLVRRLVDDHLAAGMHEIGWDGRTRASTPTGSGIYLLRLRTEGGEAVTKIVRLGR